MPRRPVLPRLLILARHLLRDDRVLLALLAVLIGAVAVAFRLAISGLQWLAWGDGGDLLASQAAGASLVADSGRPHARRPRHRYRDEPGPARRSSLLAAKLLATALSVGSGFSGGIFSPALFLGAVAGGAFGILAGLAAPGFASGSGVYATVGMGAVAGAVLGAPISTILIVFEMTADYAVTLAVMVGTVTAAALTCSLAGHDSIFAGQLARRSVAVPEDRSVAPLHLARVGDVLRTDPPTVPWHLSLAEATAALRAAPCAEVVVLDGEGGVVGMLTPADLLNEGISAGTLARKDIPRLTPADDLRQALDAFALAGMARLPVVDGGRLVGMAHERDVLAAWHRAVDKVRA